VKVILFISLFFLSLFAKEINATYRVSFGIFGQIGIAKTTLHVEGKRYKIEVHAKSTGFASFVSGGRQEWYESQGEIKDGKFLPDVYKKVVQKEVNIGDAFNDNSKTEVKKYTLIYRFNHQNKSIMATKIKTQGKKRSECNKKVKFYAKNDLLSLFFNFKKIFPSLKIKKHHVLYALGADKDTGKIDLFPLKKEEFSRLVGGGLDSLKLMKVLLRDKIFASKKGELYLGLDEDGICQKAVLKDVILFGDIRGELIKN